MSPPTRLPTNLQEPDLPQLLRLPHPRQQDNPPLSPPRGQQQRLHWHPLRPSTVAGSKSPKWLPQLELCTRRQRRRLRWAPTHFWEEVGTRQRGHFWEGEEGQDLYQQIQEGQYR